MRSGWVRPASVIGGVAVLVTATVLAAVVQNGSAPGRATAPGTRPSGPPATRTQATTAALATPSAEGNPASAECESPTSPTLRDVSRVLYLPSTATAGPIEGPPQPTIQNPRCSDWVDRTFVAYSMTGDEVTRRLMVMGPNEARDWYDPANDAVDGVPARSSQTIGGIRRDVVDLDRSDPAGRWIYVTWTEPDGGRWGAIAEGVTLDQARAALTSLTITDDMVTTAAPPPGFTTWAPPFVRSPVDRPAYILSVSYAGRLGGASGWRFYVTTDGDYPPEAPQHGRRVQIGTHSGWWRSPAALGGGRGGVLSWQQDGLRFQIAAAEAPDLTLSQAIAMAESVARVSPDDPRFTPATKQR